MNVQAELSLYPLRQGGDTETTVIGTVTALAHDHACAPIYLQVSGSI